MNKIGSIGSFHIADALKTNQVNFNLCFVIISIKIRFMFLETSKIDIKTLMKSVMKVHATFSKPCKSIRYRLFVFHFYHLAAYVDVSFCSLKTLLELNLNYNNISMVAQDSLYQASDINGVRGICHLLMFI